MAAQQFFQAIFGDSTGYAVIVLPNFDGKPVNDFWFNYPEDLDKMAALVEESKTGSVWFSPNLFESESRTKSASRTLNVAAADADVCEPENFRLQPSIVVETSPGRYQVYWLLNGEHESTEVSKLNRRIAQVHKDQGCDISFVNAAKLMRVPGTSNHKHPGAITVLSEFDETRLNYSTVNALYPESEIPDAVVAQFEGAPMPDDIEEYTRLNRSSLLTGIPNSAVLKDLLFGKYQEDRRSEARFKLLCELYRIGLDDKSVIALAWGAPTNKYRNDPRGFSGLWAEAMKAKSYIGAADNGDIEDHVELDDEEIRVQLNQTEKSYNFLTLEEAEHISGNVNFIDEWCNWASNATDAPVEYHRQAALTILSAVYSEYGHIRPSFARDKEYGMKLNVWFMTLGRSTRDRKSTARQYMITLLRALGSGSDRDYMYPEDFTPSSVSLLLPEWANLSVVYARDEVQGLFAEMLHQSYMTGGRDVMTKLYDGWTPSRARASGDKKLTKSVPVSFIMSLTGILTETAEILTVKDFKSGFLTRFLYVIAERDPDYVKPPTQQAPRDEDDDEGDKVFDAFVKRFQMNKTFWEMYVADGKTMRIYIEDDAWARFQEFEDAVEAAVADTRHREVVGSSAERMTISVLKIAALLAMDERSMTVQMSHMLQAISYAGEWFKNLIVIAGMISESEWERDCTELEKFVMTRGGKCTYAQAYRQFPSKKPQEFEQMVQALEGRGVLARTQAGNTWALEINVKE